MSPQQIAQQLYSIGWVTSQCDDQFENEKIRILMYAIEQLDHKQALRLMLKVIEVQGLQLETDFDDVDNTFRTMRNFDHMELMSFDTSDLSAEDIKMITP